MNKLNYHKWGKDHQITFEIHKYADNDNLAILMISWDEGYPEHWSTLTVNLDEKCKPTCAFIDTNNNGEDIVKWLVDNKLGHPTGKLGFSGFCVYPEFEFDMDELKKYMESGDIGA